MHVFVIGINHKTAPLEVREKFLLSDNRLREFDSCFQNRELLNERVVLSTCNRTEIYSVTQDPPNAYRELLSRLSLHSNLSIGDFCEHFYFLLNEECVSHLFSVASGLDSMVLGETEIIGQVKKAYMKSYKASTTGPVLNKLFQYALKVGKKTRSETSIGRGKISIASIALELAKKIFKNLSNAKVLLIGSGDAARMVCEAMVSNGVKQFVIANRSLDKAKALALKFGGLEAPFNSIDDRVIEADVLITSSNLERPLINESRAKDWMRKRSRRTLFIMDLGVPRNVENNVGAIADIFLYNIDDLKTLAEANAHSRKSAVNLCRAVIDESAERFMADHQKRMLVAR